MSKNNGSGNGHDKDEKKIVSFPTLAERDRARKEKEKAWRDDHKQKRKAEKVPFFNADKIPVFTRALIGSFVIVHILLAVFFDPVDMMNTVYRFGFIPGYFTGTVEWVWSAPLGILTHLFIHGSWMHLFFNVVMGTVLTMFFEREFGMRRAVIFFFICGFTGALAYFALNPFTAAPVIGASGGISGLFGGMLIMMFQQNRLGQMGRYGPWPVIIFWALFMIAMGVFSGGSMAWQAHVGGFLTGAILLRALQKGIIRF